MQNVIQHARKVGGSLMVSIPREIAELEQIAEGDFLEINFHKVMEDWFGAAKAIPSLQKEDKLDAHG